MERVRRIERPNRVRLLLDSGAFGAWSRGKDLDVKDYIRYCKENSRFIWQIVNLDSIPGKFGRRDNSMREVEVSAQLSYRNQQAMKDAGLRPIPVFHQGERIHWLETMLREGETYIGLSPSKFQRLPEQQNWLNMCFGILTERSTGRPLVRTHGFAATSFTLMTQYPWRSVDSTTWALAAAYGMIMVPAMIRDEFDYTIPPTRVIMSGVQQKNASAAARQYETLPAPQKKMVRSFIEFCGSSIGEQRASLHSRMAVTIRYYLELAKHVHDVRLTQKYASIFGPAHFDNSKMRPLKPWNLIITLATEPMNKQFSHIMTQAGANDRLLSYWNLKDRDNSVLEDFVTKGGIAPYVPPPISLNGKWGESYIVKRSLALHKRLNRSEEE